MTSYGCCAVFVMMMTVMMMVIHSPVCWYWHDLSQCDQLWMLCCICDDDDSDDDGEPFFRCVGTGMT